MSMFLFLLCIITYSITVLAGPQPVRSTPIILSDFLENLPSCATHCIESFISSSFPYCSQVEGFQDLGCLCGSKSGSDLTLGEGSLRCLVSSCVATTLTDLNSAYRVCSAIPYAQVPTHSVLSASIAAPATTSTASRPTRTSRATQSKSSNAMGPIDTHSSSTLSSRTGRSSTSATPTAPTTDIILDSSATRTFVSTHSHSASSTTTSSLTGSVTLTEVAAASTTSATSEASSQPILSKPQVAGVAIAGSVVGAAAFGLLLYLFCIRRRRHRQRDSDASFGMSSEYATYENGRQFLEAGPIGGLSQRALNRDDRQYVGVPGGPGQKRWTAWRNAMSKPPPPEIGLAISHEGHRALTQESSPISIKSYHTTSQLLPEKPVFKKSTPPKPVQFTRPQRGREVQTGDVSSTSPDIRLTAPTPPPKSERRRWKEENTSQVALQYSPPRPHPQLHNQLSDPFIDRSTDPRAIMYAMERQRASTKDLPRIITPGADARRPTINAVKSNPYHPPHLASLVPAPLNPAAYVSPRSPVTPLLPSPSIITNRAQSTKDRGIPHPPSAKPAVKDIAVSNSDRSLLPSQTQYQFNKYLPLKPSQRASTRRPETYYTTGSETSFEDDLDEPPEPPAKIVSALSPVVESPVSRATPLSRIRYPQVPGSSAERTAAKSPESSTVRQQQYERSPLSAQQTGSPGATRGKKPSIRAVQPLAQGLAELPERSSSRRARPIQTSPLQEEANRKGAKFQILCSPGLDGKMEVSGSPTTPDAHKPAKKPSPMTPPEWKASRQMHAVPKGQWID